jgi:hypothetical protein
MGAFDVVKCAPSRQGSGAVAIGKSTSVSPWRTTMPAIGDVFQDRVFFRSDDHPYLLLVKANNKHIFLQLSSHANAAIWAPVATFQPADKTGAEFSLGVSYATPYWALASDKLMAASSIFRIGTVTAAALAPLLAALPPGVAVAVASLPEHDGRRFG